MGFYNDESLWHDLIARFIVQLLLIVILSRVLHFFLSRIFREPMVIAELIAGILLGPSAFGNIPGFTESIFPPTSLPPLKLMANVGLLFFMLLVGMELDSTIFKRNVVQSVIISLCGIALPFGGGVCVALWLYDYQGSGVSLGLFVAYIGVAMSITAFPVLARILAERNLTVTRIGVLALSAAAFDDVCAWCLLALVVSIVGSSSSLGALWTVLTGLGWTLFMFFVFRPITTFIFNRYKLHNKVTPFMVAVLMCGMFGSAWMTYQIGIHEIFGAFLFGLCLPRTNHFTHNLTKRIEDLVVVFFVPLYFTNSGLGVDITKLTQGTAWGIAVVVTAVAIIGKVIGCFVPTYFLTKLNFKESLSVGFLMSTKGLVELIVLNIGFNLGVLNQVEFTIMVIMALVTTFITSPVVALIYPKKLMLLRERANFHKGKEFSVLLCIANRSQALKLLSMAKSWVALNKKNSVHALRLIEVDDRPSTYFSWGDDEEEEFDDFEPSEASTSTDEESKAQKAKKWVKSHLGLQNEQENKGFFIRWLDRLTFGWYNSQSEQPEVDGVVASIREGARMCHMKVTVIKKVSSNIKQDICNVSLTRRSDLVILGDSEAKQGKSTSKLENLLTGPVVGYVLGHARETNVGILVSNKKSRELSLLAATDERRKALVIYYGNDYDYIVIKLARKMAKEGSQSEVTILYVKDRNKDYDSSASDDDEETYATDVGGGYDTASDSEDENEEKKTKKKKKAKENNHADIEGGVKEHDEQDDERKEEEREEGEEIKTDKEDNSSTKGSDIKLISLRKKKELTEEEKEERKWLRKDPLLRECMKKKKRKGVLNILTRQKGETIEEAIERVVKEEKEKEKEREKERKESMSDVDVSTSDAGSEIKDDKEKRKFGLMIMGIGTKMNNASEVDWLLSSKLASPSVLLVRQAKSKLDKDFYEDELKTSLLATEGGLGDEEQGQAGGEKDGKKKKKHPLRKSIKNPATAIARGKESTQKFFNKYVGRKD